MAAILDFRFIKIAQGWQLHTHLDIIMGMPDMDNQKRKTASNKTRSTRMAARLVRQSFIVLNYMMYQNYTFLYC